jgi:hypothetical protein
VLIEVRKPYVDVSAHDLTLTLGAPAAPAIESLLLELGGCEIELRLLGHSHQALVDGGERASETVACLPGVAGELPLRRTDGRYDFRARVERLAGDAYAARARGVLACVGDDPRALAGVFADAPPGPGSGGAVCDAPGGGRLAPGLAFTALAAHPLAGGAGIAWTTWHGYPQTGEIVVTASRLEVAG